MKFFLIRHGQKEKHKGNPGLTILGKQQALLTGKFFLNKKIDYIASSPLLRARETASFIASPLNLKVTIKKALLERMNWGDNKNLSQREFIQLWRKTSADRSFKPKFGDSSVEAGSRLQNFLFSFSAKKYQSIILVSHGGVIVDLLRNIFGDEYLLKNFFKQSQDLIDSNVGNCSITELELDSNGDWEVRKLFSVEHLGES